MAKETNYLTEALAGVVSAFSESLEIKKILLVATHEVACNIASRNDYLQVRPLSDFSEIKKKNACTLMRENFIPVLNPDITGDKQRKYYNEAYCVCYVDTVTASTPALP